MRRCVYQPTERKGPVCARARVRGFSLVELVLVLMVLAVVAALAMPRFGNAVARYHVEAAAGRLYADLVLTRETAKQRGRSMAMTFTTERGSGWVVRGMADLEHPSSSNYNVDLTLEPYVSSIESVDMGGDTEIVFDGFGIPDTNGEIVLRSGAFTRVIRIAGTTGEIEVRK